MFPLTEALNIPPAPLFPWMKSVILKSKEWHRQTEIPVPLNLHLRGLVKRNFIPIAFGCEVTPQE